MVGVVTATRLDQEELWLASQFGAIFVVESPGKQVIVCSTY